MDSSLVIIMLLAFLLIRNQRKNAVANKIYQRTIALARWQMEAQIAAIKRGPVNLGELVGLNQESKPAQQKPILLLTYNPTGNGHG